MNDAFAALQRLRANKTAAVAGVLPAAVPPSLPLLAGDALSRRAEASKSVVNESRRILALDTWDREAMLKQAAPGGPLDYTPQLRTPNGAMQLKPIQNLALHWIKEKKGLVGPLAVGSGKTLISLLAPVVMSAQRPVLLVPPTMQIPVRREIEALQHHFRLPQNLLIIPYSQLSVAKSTALLEQVKPDLIVADECFPYETRVLTDAGSVSIGDIVEKGIGESVLSYSAEAGTFTWRPIVRRLRKSRTTGMVTVVHEYGTFRCTEEHKVWTAERGYVEAKKLTSSDTLATLPYLRQHPVPLSPTESDLREDGVSSCLLDSEDVCGCCAAGAQGCCGGGRQKPQLSEVAVPRPSEGERPCLSRVVCVSVLEPGSGYLAGSGSSSGDGVVYDLEVDDTHNYLADGVVVSNCHSIRSPDTARTKRVLRYFRQFPTTRFVALSGTLTAKSLRDYAHLCELALRGGSPLPTEEADLIAWANCLDADSTPQDRDWNLFAQFCDLRNIDDEVRRKDEARERFRERFVTTPGVVATTEASVQCSLNFVERNLSAPPAVRDALRELHRTWCRPDGEEMEEALAVWRLGMQMSQGFYLRWVWPNGVVDFEWLEARAEWHRQVRYVLQQNITGLDSPFLVWQGVAKGTLTDPTIIRAWAAWDAVRHRPPPPTETVWLDDFLVRDAVAWLREHPKGLLWHNDLAVEGALRASGVPTYGRGEVPPLAGEVGGMALSVRVHGTGLNLQHHHHENLLLSFSSSGKTMEQLIGRTHRQGQPADEVNMYYYRHTTDAQAAVLDARRNAKYIEDTQGSPQKLCYGTWV